MHHQRPLLAASMYAMYSCLSLSFSLSFSESMKMAQVYVIEINSQSAGKLMKIMKINIYRYVLSISH